METKFFKKAVNENLRYIRESNGLSTAAIAKILGVSQAKISYIENDKGILSAADVALLARRLNIPVTEFFRGLETADETDIHGLVHHLVRFGAVLLAKQKGIVVQNIPYEEIFSRSLGHLEDSRFHQGFLAALITQAGKQEIHIDQIFAKIGSSPFLVTKSIKETKAALRVAAQLERNLKFPWPRVKSQLNKIITTAENISETAGWRYEKTHSSSLTEEQLPELVNFVKECLNAKK